MTTAEFCQKYYVERKGTSNVKWDKLSIVFGDDTLLPLWIADMDFRSPDAVLDAMKTRVEHGVFGYTMVPDSYYAAYIGWQKNHHNMDIKKEEIRFAPGVVNSLYAFLYSYTDPLDSVLICPPVYYPFYNTIADTGRTLATCELDNNGGVYSLDFDKFETTIREKNVKVFILCSPHNPVSRIWTAEELEKMFRICRKYKVLVISDEIHQDFVNYDKPFVSSSVVCGGEFKDMLLTLNSATKTFNLAGLTHSHVVITNPELMAKYDAYIKLSKIVDPSMFGMVAMEASYRYGQEWLDGVKAVIRENYEYAKNEFAAKAPKIVVSPLEGTYLMWIDLSAYVSGDEMSDFMQKKCGLAVDVGSWFSENAKGFIRINLTTKPEFIKQVVESILNNLTK